MKRFVWMTSLLCVLAAMAAGCGGSKPGITNWSAKVDVQGSTVTVTTTVPGKELGKDYHPHLRLDGGPEVMQYNPSYSFRNLKAGTHKVLVTITDQGHNPISGVEPKEIPFDIQ